MKHPNKRKEKGAMKGEREVLVIAASLVWLLVLCVLFAPNQLVVIGSNTCHCGGRVFEDPTNNPYPCGQCTWYASYKRQDIPDDQYWGNAEDWDDEADGAGFFVGTIPYVRAIAVYEDWLEGVYPEGHVAYVDETQGDSFKVSEMNWNGRCYNENRWDIKRDGVSFIYPPRDSPTRLWPYEGFRVEYQETVPPSNAVLNLRWYGGTGSYDLRVEVQPRDGNGNPIGSRELVGEVFNLNSSRFNIYQWGWPACPTIPLGSWYWQVKNAGSANWSSWFSFELIGCQAHCGAAAQGGQGFGPASQTEGLGYCPAQGNPTPVPTSTPFPTIVPTPTNTPVPLDTPTIEPHTPTMVSTWTQGPTDTPPSTPTVTEHTATVVPTWTPDTPPPTPTPSGGIATPTTSGVTVTPVVCPEVTVADVMLISSHWRVRRGDANYEERFDLNHDGIVNIIDIQLVSARWGESCGD